MLDEYVDRPYQKDEHKVFQALVHKQVEPDVFTHAMARFPVAKKSMLSYQEEQEVNTLLHARILNLISYKHTEKLDRKRIKDFLPLLLTRPHSLCYMTLTQKILNFID